MGLVDEDLSGLFAHQSDIWSLAAIIFGSQLLTALLAGVAEFQSWRPAEAINAARVMNYFRW